MTVSSRAKKYLKISGIILCILLLAYWFFMHTVRGSSIALYAIGGWHAPLNVRFACAKETDSRVIEKFKLPLLFDEDTKDLLRGFWYYSYYRGCLFNHGFDFKGNAIPPSSISMQNGLYHYDNPYGGFSFTLNEKPALNIDNSLDVDFDDRLMHSRLSGDFGYLIVDTLLKHDDFKTFDDIKNSYKDHPFSTSPIMVQSVTSSASGVPLFNTHEEDSTTRIVLMTPEAHVVNIYSRNISSSTLAQVIQTLEVHAK